MVPAYEYAHESYLFCTLHDPQMCTLITLITLSPLPVSENTSDKELPQLQITDQLMGSQGHKDIEDLTWVLMFY